MGSQAHCETEFHHPAPKCGKHPAIIKIGNESNNKKRWQWHFYKNFKDMKSRPNNNFFFAENFLSFSFDIIEAPYFGSSNFAAQNI